VNAKFAESRLAEVQLPNILRHQGLRSFVAKGTLKCRDFSLYSGAKLGGGEYRLGRGFRAPAFIMFVLLAAPHFPGLLSLACFPWLAFLGAAIALRPRSVAQDLGR
jgi:hypothetical protein